VTLSNIRTAPTSAPGIEAFLDGINIDTASTRARVLSSTLNNGGDVENGSTDGRCPASRQRQRADRNSRPRLQRDGDALRADENTGTGNVQDEGYRFDGPGAIVQQCNAKNNVVAQIRDATGSTGVIHFRNIAGNSSATTVPPGAGVGFLEEGTGNRINTCQIYRNASHGVHLAGSGNALQLSTISTNVGDQVRITGDNNFIDQNSITRVSTGTGAFISLTPAVNAPGGANSNFFNRNRAQHRGADDAGEWIYRGRCGQQRRAEQPGSVDPTRWIRLRTCDRCLCV
jgi:hypothetical protein